MGMEMRRGSCPEWATSWNEGELSCKEDATHFLSRIYQAEGLDPCIPQPLRRGVTLREIVGAAESSRAACVRRQKPTLRYGSNQKHTQRSRVWIDFGRAARERDAVQPFKIVERNKDLITLSLQP
jgi:hypothetical protein